MELSGSDYYFSKCLPGGGRFLYATPVPESEQHFYSGIITAVNSISSIAVQVLVENHSSSFHYYTNLMKSLSVGEFYTSSLLARASILIYYSLYEWSSFLIGCFCCIVMSCQDRLAYVTGGKISFLGIIDIQGCL